MKVRAVQFAPRLGDVEHNLRFHEEKVAAARKDGCDLVVFPELSLTGYHLKDILNDVSLRPGDPVMQRLLKLSREVDLLVGAPLEDPPGVVFNCALYLSGGELAHCHRKVQLPNFGMFEERMLFAPGREFVAFRAGGMCLGVLICREILFPVNAWLYHLQHTDFLIGISNSPFRGLGPDGFSSFALWENMGYVHAVMYHQNYLFVNRTGFEDGIGFGGGSFFASPGRGITLRAPYLDSADLDVEIDAGAVRRARLAGNYLRDERPEVIRSELERLSHA